VIGAAVQISLIVRGCFIPTGHTFMQPTQQEEGFIFFRSAGFVEVIFVVANGVAVGIESVVNHRGIVIIFVGHRIFWILIGVTFERLRCFLILSGFFVQRRQKLSGV